MDYFSKTYKEAREKFLIYADKANANISSLYLDDILGTDNEELSTDIAWIGNKDANHLYIHSSGIHGVEGYAGSAIQCKILNETQFNFLPKNIAIVFIHAINPYGMSHNRRWNENNVDLNRNFMNQELFEKSKTFCSKIYEKINYILNPKEEPYNWYLNFYWYMSGVKLFYNNQDIKNAVAGGQGKYEKGLFFCGNKLEITPFKIINFITNTFKNITNIVHIDVHTGLGPYSFDTLLCNKTTSSEYNFIEELEKSDDERKHVQKKEFDNGSNNISYETIGSFKDGIEKICFPNAKYYGVTQEFGTYSGLEVIKALREENYYTHYQVINKGHFSRETLLKTFYPYEDENWKNYVLDRGNIIFNTSFDFLMKN